MASRRETLIANVKTRLEAIIGDTAYSFGDSLRAVDRYIHTWTGEQSEGAETANTPKILIRTVGETTASDGTVEMWAKTLTLDLHFMFFGGEVTDTDLNAALADMEKALAPGFADGFGVGARQFATTNRLIDPETGGPSDGLHLELTAVYETLINDPSTE